MNQKTLIQVGVAARNASGQPDVVYFDVQGTQAQIDNGEHYDMGVAMAQEAGYEPKLAFDSTDPAWNSLNQDTSTLITLLERLKILGVDTDGTNAVQTLPELYAKVTGQILPGANSTIKAAHQASRSELARQFMQELLDSVETLSGIADTHGSRTLADLMYLQNAILSGNYIDHYPGESKVLEIANSLPSGARWAKYIDLTADSSDAPATAAGSLSQGDDKDRFLLILMDGRKPELLGPFADDFDRMWTHKEFIDVEGNKHGLYPLDVPKGVVPVVGNFEDPVITHILERFAAGDEPISKPRIPGALYFTVNFEGDDLVFNNQMLESIEAILKDKLVMVDRMVENRLVPTAKAAEDYPRADWQKDVTQGDTKLGHQEWLEHNLKSEKHAFTL